jgi:branched-chain amino acid transport system ATP-binding protein
MTGVPDKSFFKVRNLMVSFGSMVALKSVTFDVPRGGVFGIAGPNGAGKTTLLNVIAGAIRPTEGSVWLEGEQISGLKPMAVCHKGIGRTFQIPVVFPTLSVFNNIKIGMTFGHTSGKKRLKTIGEIIEFVGLNGKEEMIAGNLDLYSRKLVMLGAALATGPKVLLLDEPLGGLNFQEIEKYLRVIQEVNREMGITLLLVEHLFDKLVEISHEVMILHFGEKIYLGSANTVGDDPTVIQVYLGMKHYAAGRTS